MCYYDAAVYNFGYLAFKLLTIAQIADHGDELDVLQAERLKTLW